VSVIAVVDDREEMRDSVADRIRLGLEDLKLDWEVIADEPLESIDAYPAWIADNDVAVLVLDEKLGEEIGRRGVAAAYTGHEVAAALRELIPDLPQLIITSIKNSDELEGAAELDAIVQRDEFNKHWRVYVERMVRLAKSFVDRNEADLAELTSLSQKMVDGSALPTDVDRLNAIREKVQMVAKPDETIAMRQVLEDAENVRRQLQRVLDQLRSKSP
jgi:hypothetical protein